MKVVVAKTQTEILDNSYVRGQVFIVEQGIDWEIEFDNLDKQCVLFTCYVDNVACGAARLYKNKVGRVATLKEYRGQGIAKAVMKKIEEYAKEIGLSQIKLHAQLYVKDFYLKLGYQVVGDIFYEADIEHVLMIKEI